MKFLKEILQSDAREITNILEFNLYLFIYLLILILLLTNLNLTEKMILKKMLQL